MYTLSPVWVWQSAWNVAHDCPRSGRGPTHVNAARVMRLSGRRLRSHIVKHTTIQNVTSERSKVGGLTVRLSGRPQTLDQRRGRTLSSSARGANPLTPHGPSNDC